MPETSTINLRFPIVGAQWLAANIAAPNLVILDASVGEFAGANTGIPGARRFDIDGEFSARGRTHHAKRRGL